MRASSIKDLLSYQYEMIMGSREVVLNFCEKFNPSDYTNEVQGFGRGSICTTQLHIANTYTFWIANSIMNKSAPYHKYEPVNISFVKKAFDDVNLFMKVFIEEYSENINRELLINIKDDTDKIKASPLMVFTHVITHEFHHKGQVMSMSRLLGYTPPDADVIRFI